MFHPNDEIHGPPPLFPNGTAGNGVLMQEVDHGELQRVEPAGGDRGAAVAVAVGVGEGEQ